MTKVLIIEDEEVLLSVLQKKLINEGFDTAVAKDGEEGLRCMREFKPDLVLLDIVMPKKDGYGVLTEMSQDAELVTIPVIIISNSGQPVEIEKAAQLGAKDFLIKANFKPEEVIEKMKNVLGEANFPQKSSKKSSGKKNAASRGNKILIVEDDRFLRDLIAKKLTSEGFKINLALDGPEALESVEKEKPDLILLDIILPGVNGFEVLKKLKEMPAYQDIPVIILSNLSQADDVKKGTELGAVDFLIKAHFTPSEIVAKVRQVLR